MYRNEFSPQKLSTSSASYQLGTSRRTTTYADVRFSAMCACALCTMWMTVDASTLASAIWQRYSDGVWENAFDAILVGFLLCGRHLRCLVYLLNCGFFMLFLKKEHVRKMDIRMVQCKSGSDQSDSELYCNLNAFLRS